VVWRTREHNGLAVTRVTGLVITKIDFYRLLHIFGRLAFLAIPQRWLKKFKLCQINSTALWIFQLFFNVLYIVFALQL